MTKKEMLKELLTGPDWGDVFRYGKKPDVEPPGSKVSGADFGLDDVKSVVAMHTGNFDGDEWLAVVRLKDGRYARVDATSDYTGRGWEESGSSAVAGTLQDLIRYGMSDAQRVRLGLSYTQTQPPRQGNRP